MAEHTFLHVAIARCPTNQLDVLLEILYRYLSVDDTDVALTGEPCPAVMAPVGSVGELTARITAAAPGVAFWCWEEPVYEWLGTLCRYVPELGLFTQSCDAEATPVFTPDEIRPWMSGDHPLTELGLERALGDTHTRALKALAEHSSAVPGPDQHGAQP